MKKLVYLLVAVSLMLALVPAVASADEITVDLLAGQTTDIGDVKVWNDADTLYVQFVYEGPDCGFLEVHLQVDEGDWSEDILTKKGNPIPGQFEMSHKPGGCFTEHTFAFDLSDEGFDVGDTLMIAAHAALGLAETMTIVSDTSTAVTEVNGTPVTANAVLANEPVGYPNCASYAPDGTGSAWDSAVNIPGAHWIWNTLNPEHPIEGDIVTFQKAFSVPGLPNGGTLYITADNGYKAMLNGVLLGSAQLGPGFPTTLKETTDTTPQAGNWGVASQGWQSVESYSLTELVSGENTLVFIAANEYMWNTTDQYQGKDYYYGSWDPPGGSVNADPFPGYGIGVDNICRNPGALIFKATVDYYASGETAWGAGTRFTEDKNWATYFPYTVQSAGPTVTPGAPTWTRAAGVRYKGWNTGKEIFLGPMLPPSALPRAEAEYNEFGTVGQKTYQITFAFDQGENAISTSITSPDASLTFDFDVSGAPGCPSTGWDAMEIYVRDSRSDSGVALQNVTLDSFTLGNFGTVDKAGTPGGQNWTVTGFDFSQSFQVTADLVVDGYNGNENIKVEFNVGCLTP